ncbi:PDZ domain [Popillia japonica]|uniref:PDZ domain n=1 Tax=Popillia japonica TaxID=7064 RepID=A0AAW1IEH1_POPJA
MAEEISVVLSRSDSSGFGFSLLGKPGLPPIIYNILDDSPAAESGEVEVGDVILKVNETDVNRFSTKEDPKIKASLRKHLLSHGDSDMAAVHKGGGGGGLGNSTALTNTVYAHQRPEPAIHQASHAGTNGSYPEQEPLLSSSSGGSNNRLVVVDDEERLQWEPLLANNSPDQKAKGQPKFEAFTMTGEYIINISRTQQSLIPKQQKKADNLRYHNSHTHHLRHQHNSVPNSPNEMDIGYRKNHCKSGSNSANTSPISANKRDSPIGEHAKSSTSFNTTFVRTSRSEDQLQDTKNMSAVDIEIDDDVTSSLNTLLDTRPDSGSTNNVCSSSNNSDRIVWTYNAPVTTFHEQRVFVEQQQRPHRVDVQRPGDDHLRTAQAGAHPLQR